MAKKLASGSSKNKKDSAGRRLGFKVFPTQYVRAGGIILRQRGTKWYSGRNTTLGRDHSVNATCSGWVNSFERKGRRYLVVDLA